VKIGAHVAQPRIETEGVQDGAHYRRSLQLSIGVEGEPARSGIEYDPAAWEVLVFVPGNLPGQAFSGQAGGPETAPTFPDVMVAG